MTMSGQQHSHKPRSGKQILSLIILILVACSIFWGCTDQVASVLPGPGRADWEVQLSDQYYIIKANSSSKKLCKTTDTPGLYENVLSYFYVTKYCVFEPFICVEGIPTEEIFASEEERTSDKRQYYLLNVQEGTLYGPHDTENTLIESALTNDIELTLVWELPPQ